MESRDAAEGIFERELWLQTFHLVLYLAKAGCRVAGLSGGTRQRREEGRDKRRGRERKCNEQKEKRAKKNAQTSLSSINNLFMLLPGLRKEGVNEDE